MKLSQLLEQTRNNYSSLAIGKIQFDRLFNTPFKDFINDNNKCAEFVFLVSKDNNVDPKSKNKIIRRKERSSHCVSIWLMGIAINNNINVLDKDSYIYTNYLWTKTSVNHDYGYYLKSTYKKNTQIKELTKNYNLLDDIYSDNNLVYLNNIRKKSFYSNFFHMSQKK